MLKRNDKFAAETLGKPEDYISVHLDHNKPLTFKGTFEPAFLLTIVSPVRPSFTPTCQPLHEQVSLDNLQPEKNEKYSKAFFEFFKEKLNVPGDRGYMCVMTTRPRHRHRGIDLGTAPSLILAGRT